MSASVLNYDCDVERQCHGHGVSSAGASAPTNSALRMAAKAVSFDTTSSVSIRGSLTYIYLKALKIIISLLGRSNSQFQDC